MSQHFVHNKTIVDDRGIRKPYVEYTVDGTCSQYTTVMTKEDFIKAYIKYILIPQIKYKEANSKHTSTLVRDYDGIEKDLLDLFLNGGIGGGDLLELL